MSDLKLELVMSVREFVDRKAHHATLFYFATRYVAESSLSDYNDNVLVT